MITIIFILLLIIFYFMVSDRYSKKEEFQKATHYPHYLPKEISHYSSIISYEEYIEVINFLEKKDLQILYHKEENKLILIRNQKETK